MNNTELKVPDDLRNLINENHWIVPLSHWQRIKNALTVPVLVVGLFGSGYLVWTLGTLVVAIVQYAL